MMKKQNFVITGMTCSACSSRVEKCVSAMDGTEDVSVNLLTNSMRLSYDEDKTSEEEIIQTVIRAGYGASVKGAETAGHTADAANPQEEQIHNLKIRFFVSLCFWIPLMFISMGHMFHSWFGMPIPGFMTDYFYGNENVITFAFLPVSSAPAHRLAEPRLLSDRIPDAGSQKSQYGQSDRRRSFSRHRIRHFRHLPARLRTRTRRQRTGGTLQYGYLL